MHEHCPSPAQKDLTAIQRAQGTALVPGEPVHDPGVTHGMADISLLSCTFSLITTDTGCLTQLTGERVIGWDRLSVGLAKGLLVLSCLTK